MTKKTFKVPLTHEEMAMVVESLRLWRQALVSQGAIEFFSKEQKNLLADIRVDVETLTTKLDELWSGK
jgi:hypothetical protein